MNKRWQQTKNQVLGENFDLSLVFADNKLMKKLNERYRKKTGATNVLSFCLSKNIGEIFLNRGGITKTAQKIKLPVKKYTDYLFIHSLLHLKGYKHGKRMEREEQRILKKYG